MNLVRKEYELTCMAPVHIGNGITLKAYEYVYDDHQQQVLFLDEKKWIAFLYEKGLMDDFAEYINITARALAGKGNFRGQYLWDWLFCHGVAAEEIRALSKRRVTVAKDKIINGKNHLNDIAQQVMLPDGRLYIPGSTIKGALRTAILWQAIEQHPAHFAGIWGQLRSLDFENPRYTKRKIGDEIRLLEQQILHALDVTHTAHDAVNSALRGLRISDASTDAKKTIILQKIDESMQAGYPQPKEKFLPIFRECIPAGTKLHVSITADFPMLQTIGISSLEELMHTLHAYTQDTLLAEKKVFGHVNANIFCEAEMADVLLGGGTGFLSKTLVRALAPDEREAKRFISHYLDMAFSRSRKPMHNHVKLDKFMSPRTLKVAKAGQKTWILGLCRFEEMTGC
ncbi:type III-A CRISPR-associated RAMP protein Csm5 [Mitsuokella sp. AF21-1AC]|uniref:type III-A CRISPR-associated RAMP protein Csm5 n=1 Tax=Mitsuokella sp. AF21-1AC TaxID=2292235 RepID=UPI000E54EB5F|nr:type III-A CRISPR-associated RAMP protein Csm5 [Mitsuokella sp. AF21-1AC]RGS72691.1 type III-A CRISPR-associated RAMP protein Csm5 [Mitsuokella sp. AF21-1AC]